MKVLSCVAALVCPFAMATGQSATEKLSLSSAFERAIQFRPEVAAARAQRGAALSKLQQARSAMLPTILFQGVATDGPSGAPGFGPLQNPSLLGSAPLGLEGLAADPLKKNFGAGITISQTLFDSWRTQHLTAARSKLLDAAGSDTSTQIAEVLLSVAQAYYGTLRAQRLAEVREQDVLQREATVRQAKAFVDGQLRSGIDLQNAMANLAEAKSALIAAQNEVKFAFVRLNNAMGETSLKEFALDSAETDAAEAIQTAEAAMDLAAQNRPESKGVAHQLQAADQLVRGVSSDAGPRLDAVASFGAVNASSLIQNSKNYAVGIVLSIPISTGGFVEGRLSEEKRNRDAIVAKQRSIKESIKLQAAKAWLDLQTQIGQAKAAEEQVKAARESLRLASERYKLQLSSIVELSESESLAIKAQTQLAEAKYAVKLAALTLDWATGSTVQRYGAASSTELPGKKR